MEAGERNLVRAHMCLALPEVLDGADREVAAVLLERSPARALGKLFTEQCLDSSVSFSAKGMCVDGTRVSGEDARLVFVRSELMSGRIFSSLDDLSGTLDVLRPCRGEDYML